MLLNILLGLLGLLGRLGLLGLLGLLGALLAQPGVLLAQHVVISARAGLITYVGNMDLEIDDHIGEGNEIRTGRRSRFEAMLGSDTYVRMRNGAAIVLENEALDNTALRLVRGSTIINARKVDSDFPIRVLIGDLEFSIQKDGLYLFDQSSVTVLDGELRVNSTQGHFSDTRLQKDRSLVQSEDSGLFQEERVEDTSDIDSLPLVRWSRQRTEQLTPDPVFRKGRRSGRRSRF